MNDPAAPGRAALASRMAAVRRGEAESEEARRRRKYTRNVVLFIFAHLLLAMVMRAVPVVASLHGYAILLVGIIWILGKKPMVYIAYLAAYITGSEMLWRMMMASLFWEFGKYAVALLLFLMLLRHGKLVDAKKFIIIYFFLLVPSSIYANRVDMISFNLSGPLALAVSTVFFSALEIDRNQFERILIAIVAPVATVALIVLLGIASAEQIIFSAGGSNMSTSGGVGPNQMSSVLALGALASFFFVLTNRGHPWLRRLMIILGIWMTGQSAMTFSRGGLMSTAGALLVLFFYMIRSKRVRSSYFIRGAFVAVIIVLLVYPFLEDVTEGKLKERYAPTDKLKQQEYLTGRDKHIVNDIRAFEENPFLGTGPGESKQYHHNRGSAHTEFTRMLAEHGSLGIAALLILLFTVYQRFRLKKPHLEKAVILSLTTWAITYTFHQAMRLVAPSFIFGLAAANLTLTEESGTEQPE
jgi:hypothetical protein